MNSDGFEKGNEWIGDMYRLAREARERFEQEQQAQYDALLNGKLEWVTYYMAPPDIMPRRKRPAELDDKDRKSPWGHIPFHG